MLLALVVTTILLQLAVLYLPFLRQFFEVTALSGIELLLCTGLGVGMLLLIEVEKVFLRRRG